jgi:hypothetical protein
MAAWPRGISILPVCGLGGDVRGLLLTGRKRSQGETLVIGKKYL